MKRIAIVAAFLVWGCASQTGRNMSTLPMGTCDAIKQFFDGELTEYQERVDRASREYQEEEWRVETADAKASQEKLSARFEEMQRVSYDKAVLEQTKALWEASKLLDATSCPLKTKLERVKDMLSSSILTDAKVIAKEKANKDLQDKLVEKNNAFRMTVEGEPAPLSRALFLKKLGALKDRNARKSLYFKHNPARADAWLEWGFRDLLKSRNEEAKLAGFSNYYEYQFFRSQLDFQNYRDRVREVKTKLAPKVRRKVVQMGKKLSLPKVEAWDFRYVRDNAGSGELNELLKDFPENRVMEVATEFYKALGIDVPSYHFTMDLYPREGKNTHAFAMLVTYPHVDASGKVLPNPPVDIRFLANLKQPVKWDDISTIIHELGHAIHGGEVRQPLAIFRGIGSVDTEAIAMTLERMAESPEFMSDTLPKITKTPAPELQKIIERKDKMTRAEQAITLLRQVFFSDFEYQMYVNPDQDPKTLWSKMHKEWWGIDVPVVTADWDVDHFLMAPVYVQNYAIGILMVEQIYASILQDFKTSYRSREIGDKLKQLYFGPGEEFDYLDLTRRFTRQPLTAESALKLL